MSAIEQRYLVQMLRPVLRVSTEYSVRVSYSRTLVRSTLDGEIRCRRAVVPVGGIYELQQVNKVEEIPQ